MNVFNSEVRVYIEDTDAGGIVYYVNYLKFMERSRSELFRHLGHNKAAMGIDNMLFVVSSANVNYVQPARLDDKLIVSTVITRLGRAGLDFEQNIRFGNSTTENELICQGQVKVANVDAQTMKPIAMPKRLYQLLLQYQNDR